MGLMLEPARYSYYVLVMTKEGKTYDVTDMVEDLGWEELEDELASRITFTAKNDKTSQGRLSSLARPGCWVFLRYRYKNKTNEATRGKVVEWTPSRKLSAVTVKIKAYDDLYDMQECQDNFFFSSGVSTKSMLNQIFQKWKIPQGKYVGPNVTHGKMKFNNKKIGSIVKEILEDAKKRGGGPGIVRAIKGEVQVVPFGVNLHPYHFEEEGHLTSLSHKITTQGMVTRVKVLGEADDDDRRPVEATIDGKTQYGIRQKFYTRGSDESLEEAKKAAKDILDEDGKPKDTVKIKTQDIPIMRKGNRLHLKCSVGTGFYHVLSVTHDCDKMEMTLNIQKAQEEEVVKTTEKTTKKKSYSVGDIVQFKGGTHYVSSYPDARGYRVGPGPAKITIANGSGKAHPWHLVTENWNQTHVWGWVDDGTFE